MPLLSSENDPCQRPKVACVLPIASLLLQGALAQGSRLVGSAAFDMFIAGGLSCDVAIVGVNGLSNV